MRLSSLPVQSQHVSPGLSDAIAGMRTRLAHTAQESVTGRYSDLTQQLQGRIGDAMLARKALDDIANERMILSLRESRLSVVQSSLTQVQSASEGFSTRLQAALGRGDRLETALIARDADAALSQVFAALNVRQGERFLFSGDATATAPLPDRESLLADLRALATSAPDAVNFNAAVATYFDDPAGPWHQGVFAGSTGASDPDAVKADAPALSQLVAGLAVLSLAQPKENLALLQSEPAILNNAADLLRAGEAGLTQMRSDRGVVQESLARARAALDVEETVLSENFNRLTVRDQYEAASELRQMESNLEAAYLLTSRLSNLTLLNFIR